MAGELAAVPKARLDTIFGGEKAQRLFNLSHGIDDDEVRLVIGLHEA